MSTAASRGVLPLSSTALGAEQCFIVYAVSLPMASEGDQNVVIHSCGSHVVLAGYFTPSYLGSSHRSRNCWTGPGPWQGDGPQAPAPERRLCEHVLHTALTNTVNKWGDTWALSITWKSASGDQIL